ncbi:pyrroline-5-carboxylate reductase [Anoxynatronum buryatiense]|uniref:Pyrroline-5-carboxylate reductase n=1 Tax=Anoxynatronum buryatiense TaxID=489973 RepID=A0AA45WZ90_9CLOT|nr:pyrroline-5-carboxylate reductase [Anoxynatronum buryatiense]SMP67193.1 pyrroline-5-carboxylate reductase [Anoxynatronum buryatiense]
MQDKHIGFIGAGNMAKALIQGMVQSGQFAPAHIRFNDKLQSEHHPLEIAGQSIVSMDKEGLVTWSDVLVLAVKPQDLFNLLREVDPLATERKLFISIAAGIDIAGLTKSLSVAHPVVRAMPNTSARVLASATALTGNAAVTPGDMALAERIFQCVGAVVQVEESQMPGVTGLSGSGPAYVYAFLRAMIEGGVSLGLSHDTASQLAIQTLRGAVEMAAASEDDLDTLIRQICSPNGTTLAGMKVLETRHFQEHVMEAIQASAQRSEELRRELQADIRE